ncbi:hypothetical protein Mal64_24710 [Pseudobythopirellula maris]|uniref:Uncharacterized protein n=1 Tax=Pseudobythopirellula maris TaxID=2527991 RepID=A0A5C5ZP58_9BACT|nr:hypothetical protein [Pseudobythopirellula maris]TWT88980.1 hypothetical protein Mal64_24710 [Pseudobythopirellula maris]
MKTNHRNLMLRRRAAARRSRRGVLLLVVLSMLVLFMLIGTAFLVSSDQHRTAARILEKKNRATSQPDDLLERALMQLLRDTNNRHSAIRYHSLLRDAYGTDGFEARVMTASVDGVLDSDIFPRYAGATTAQMLGPTEGQFVDLYVSDRQDLRITEAGRRLDPTNAVGLDYDNQGLPVDYQLSQTDGYYNGCLLTMTEGPLAGESVRVVDYEYLGQGLAQGDTSNNGETRVGRLRVMAPRRQDGGALRFVAPTDPSLSDFLKIKNGQTVGYRFVVNGRPYNGAGVGFNAYADYNGPRLTALEAVELPTGEWVGVEPALAPNAQHFNLGNVAYLDPALATDPFAAGLTFRSNGGAPAATDGLRPLFDPSLSASLYSHFPGAGDTDESYDAADFQNLFLALQSTTPRHRGRVMLNNGARVDPDSGYDADEAVRLDLEDLPIPSFHRPALVNFWFHRLHRSTWLTSLIDNADERALAILRPLVDGESNQDVSGLDLVTALKIAELKRKFILRPLTDDHPDFDGGNLLSRYEGTSAVPGAAALLNAAGEITFPYWEAVGPWDVDNDNDGAADSVWVDIGLPVQKTEDGRLYKPLVAMLVEDLDGRLNLNAHGSAEHFVSDDLDRSTLRDAVTNDFSSDLNRNLAQDFTSGQILQSSNQLPHGEGWGPADITLRSVLSPNLPLAEQQNHSLGGSEPYTGIAQFDDYARLLAGRPDPNDDGRFVATVIDIAEPWGRYGSFSADKASVSDGRGYYSPGHTFDVNDPFTTRDPRVWTDFFGFPTYIGLNEPAAGFGEMPDLFSRYSAGVGATGSPLREVNADRNDAISGSYSRPILDDSPYELNLSAEARRRPVADLQAVVNSYPAGAPINDDAPFSPAELERVLRANDADAGDLEGRLWNLVDAFDPAKLAYQNRLDEAINDNTIGSNTTENFAPDDLQALVAEQQAAINRRLVTTDSHEVPTPNDYWTTRLILGADGLPGVPRDTTVAGNPMPADDDGDGLVNEGDETVFVFNTNSVATYTFPNGAAIDYDTLWYADCDDYAVVMRDTAPTNARLTDYLRYRVVLELKRQGIIPVDLSFRTGVSGQVELARANKLINEVIHGDNTRPTEFSRNRDLNDGGIDDQTVDMRNIPPFFSYGGLLAPEVLAGLRMDLNRPFGDGRDNNGNGVVDEPQEAGEPYADANGNGVWDGSEPYADLNGNGVFDPPLDWIDVNNNGVQDAGELNNFDYTAGRDTNGRGAYVSGAPLRDDSRMARQLYARHLYCLTLLLMDENYLAPYDDNDPQVLHYLDPLSGSYNNSADPPEDLKSDPDVLKSNIRSDSSTAYRLRWDLKGEIEEELIAAGATDAHEQALEQSVQAARVAAMRKLTRRQIAQWAINVADMRDPDAIMTPFEYDENPWDGWNVAQYDYSPTRRSEKTPIAVFPIDGDVTTNEGAGFVREVTAGGFGAPVQRLVDSDEPINDFDNTYGLVWGAERPEALITEGLAWHDRRLTDDEIPESSGNKGDGGQVGANQDDDLDQRYKPKGNCFFELLNPWPFGGQRPAEIYSYVDVLDKDGDGDTTERIFSQGVEFDRLSDLPADPSQPIRSRSPVWRFICVEDHPMVRNSTVDPSAAEADARIQGDVKLADDDPAHRLNDGTYEDSPMANGPWAYTSEKIREVGGKTIPPLTFAYRQFWSRKVLEAQNSLATSTDDAAAGTGLRETPPTPLDPNFPGFDRFAQPVDLGDVEIEISSRLHGRETGGPRTLTGTEQTPAPQVIDREITRRVLQKPNQYIERAFYMIAPVTETAAAGPTVGFGPPVASTTPKIDLTAPGWRVPKLAYELSASAPANLVRERGPAVGVKLTGVAPGGEVGTGGSVLEVHASKFAPLNRIKYTDDTDANLPAVGKPIPLAPLLPGRRAVVGSIGAVYNRDLRDESATLSDDANKLAGRYTTLVSRLLESAGGEVENEFLDGSPHAGVSSNQQLRRFEMMPHPSPDVHQFVLRMNGGSESRLVLGPPIDGEANDDYYNITATADLLASEHATTPVIAIPIDGFSVSEPLDEYFVRQLELDPSLDIIYRPNTSGAVSSAKPAEGYFETPFDEPFDVLPELVENQTTPNYRTMCLERLANPLLPWNPPPRRSDGSENPQHDANLEVNPYVTVDTMPLDLTAFNSTSSRESELETPAESEYVHVPDTSVSGPEVRHRTPRSLPNAGGEDVNTAIMFKSHERGWPWGAIEEAWPLAMNRLLWRQANPTTTTEISHPESPHAVTAADRMTKERLDDDSVKAFLTFDEKFLGTGYEEHVIDFSYLTSLGFGDVNDEEFLVGQDLLWDREDDPNNDGRIDNLAIAAETFDIDGDGVAGEALGTPMVKLADDTNTTLPSGALEKPETLRNNSAFATFHWPNRPFVSASELLQAPMHGANRMLTYFSGFNAAAPAQPNPWNGEEAVLNGANAAELTNTARRAPTMAPFGQLLPFFQTAADPAQQRTYQIQYPDPNDPSNTITEAKVIAYGAPHFYRLLDYVHTPSRFVATDTLLNPTQFADPTVEPADPRAGLVAPFNRVDHYREPGKVNLNTVVGRRGVDDDTDLLPEMWSEVYDGIMHRLKDGNFIDSAGTQLLQTGHLGPAWRDVVVSRRGYAGAAPLPAGGVHDYSPRLLNASFPTFFANPFRSPNAGFDAPLANMTQGGSDASMLRAHPTSPGPDGAWGSRYQDDLTVNSSSDGVLDDAGEAGLGDDLALVRSGGAIPDSLLTDSAGDDKVTVVPLFSGASLEPSLDTERNASLRYQPMTRLANMTTGRSGTFAVWITVGFFEVTPANEHPVIAERYGWDTTTGPADDQLALFNQVYPDGYVLGRELGSDTGDTNRARGFYLIDRTQPVAFRPGDDANVERAILLRRRIE